MYNLAGRVALVTGGALGIGFGIARELAEAGSRVIIADRNLEKASAAAAHINRKERAIEAAIALRLDVSDKQSIKQCTERAIGYFSHIDILVNNAGIFQNRLGLELEDEEFNRCLDVNLTGIWRMVQALVPLFRTQGGGSIINIASVGGRKGVDFASAYCASKAGVISLTQSLAATLGPDKINVNTICPGSISTAMQDEIKALRNQGVSNNRTPPVLPLAGPLTVEDIGYAVVFLASRYAKNITGQALNVDCGYMMN